ncbi:hypothetical protein P692DRAFT_20780123, partial [Suillus brevipes Sb2]
MLLLNHRKMVLITCIIPLNTSTAYHTCIFLLIATIHQPNFMTCTSKVKSTHPFANLIQCRSSSREAI